MAVLPKKAGRSNGYSLPKGFKGVKTTSSSSLEQLKKDAESRPSKEVRLKDGQAVTIRILHEPIGDTPWHRFDEHYVREGSAGSYVPCIGEGCPLDGDPNARSSRKWLANVLDVGTGEVRLLKMTKAMVDSFIIKYERSGKGDREPSLMKRNYTIIRIGDGTDTTYEIENEDAGPVEVNGRPVKLSKLKLIDIKEELNDRVKRFYGGSTKSTARAAALDDDEDDEELEEELEDDDDELDDELEEDEDDDEEEEVPVRKKKRTAIKAKKKVRK